MKQILIVDDLEENLYVLSRMIKNNIPDSEIYKADSFKSAINYCNVIIPDLIITDWDMPFKTGIDLISYLKSNSLTSGIPIIVATGVMIDSMHLKEALEAGANDYVRKPFDEVELIARTKSALKISEYYKQNQIQTNKKLSLKALHLAENYNLLKKIIKQISNIKNYKCDVKCNEIVDNIIIDLNENLKKNSWQKFNKIFENTHTEFQIKIINQHKNITKAELKLCNLIFLGMSCKKIAEVLHQSEKSIRVTRSRLRKKFNLTKNQNLEIYLKNL